jgi:hypothetical protein
MRATPTLLDLLATAALQAPGATAVVARDHVLTFVE